MKNRYQIDPDGARLPVKLDTTTNGEYLPRPLPLHVRETISMARSTGRQKTPHG